MLVRQVSNILPFHRVRDQMEDLFNQLWAPAHRAGFNPGGPAFNIHENDESLLVETELPGVALSDVDVTVMGRELTIKGERKETLGEGVIQHRRERPTGSFIRVATLPMEIDAQRVTAMLKDGVLTVTLPKAEAAKPRKIEVR